MITERLQKDTISTKIVQKWNKLPFQLQATLQTDTFSKLLKTYLFKQAFKNAELFNNLYSEQCLIFNIIRFN